MRLRLGLLQDTAAIERQAAKEAAEAQARKQRLDAPTVKTEAQTKLDEGAVAREKKDPTLKTKTATKPRIRPLSEAKAIDTGANFISETFLFLVGGSLIVFESFRSRRKESNRREDVAGRIGELEESERNARRALVALEKELLQLKREDARSAGGRILPQEVWELEEKEEKVEEEVGRFRWMRSLLPRKRQGAETPPAEVVSSRSPRFEKEISPSGLKPTVEAKSPSPSKS